MRTYNILYVDDEQNNLVVFKNAFFRNYNIYTALSGKEGLDVLSKEDIHLIITDQKMAGMTGVEFLEKVIEIYPDTERMILTAYSDVDFIIRAINKCGIFQYILKPWDSRALKIVIDNAINSYQLKKDKKNLINDLKEANLQLEQKVKERTVALDHKNEMLQKTNEIKDKLFSIISHDLRVPMASLNVLMEVMIQTQANISVEDFKKYSLKVRTYIQSVMNLLDNLLNWSLSQLGDNKVVIESLDLQKVINENIKLFEIAAIEKDITLEGALETSKIQVSGDQNMTNLIVRNLLSNAIKFTPKGGKVSVVVKSNKGHAHISIKDTGIGISKEDLEKLFDQDYFSTNRGTAHEKGTGIGLKLCKEFTQKQNGTFLIKTNQDIGTTFSFTIPLSPV